METFEARMNRYIAEYNAAVWPDMPVPAIEEGWGLDFLEIRAEGFSNGHIEGEHEEFGDCPYKSSEECGERAAAAEFVETR